MGRALAGAAVVLTGSVAGAQIPNGGFESGDLAGWVVGGTGHVEALQQADFSSGITPPEGSYLALLSTGPDKVGGVPDGDYDASGHKDKDVATLAVTFTTTTPNTSLSFQWAFATSEASPAPGEDDIFDVTLNGYPLLRRSANLPGGESPWPDTPPYDAVACTVSSSGLTDGSQFADGVSPFRSVSIAVADPGTYILQFRIADQKDDKNDSGLLLDDVQLNGSSQAMTQLTDTGGAYLEVKDGGFVWSTQENGPFASSQDGSVLAFVSNANLSGDNPSNQTQVFVDEGGVYERLTAMVDGSAGPPSLTSNGRWVALSATSDGNEEIYRVDRRAAGRPVQQITTTSGCRNSDPSISDDVLGDRIAYVSNCSGDDRVVVWDWNGGGTPVFREKGAAGCRTYEPAIAQDAAGRWVAFVSNCDLVAGGNPDGNFEVFRWDLDTDDLVQITDSVAPTVNDGVTASADGRYLAFVSDADYTGGNPDGSLDVFRFDALGGLQQITDGTALTCYLTADIDDEGRYLAVEQLDLLSGDSKIQVVDAGDGITTTVAAGDVMLPAVAVQGDAPLAVFQARDDYLGNNPDGNTELWRGRGLFRPTFICSSPNAAIPDHGEVTVTLDYPTAMTIADINVYLKIDHSDVGDLWLELEHGGGKVKLIDKPEHCDGEDIEAVLDDEAAVPVDDICAWPPPAIAGTYIPEQSLNGNFAGDDASGTWSLKIQDKTTGDTGTLLEWCLYFGTE